MSARRIAHRLSIRSAVFFRAILFTDGWARAGREKYPRDEQSGLSHTPLRRRPRACAWGASKRVMPAVEAAIDAHGDDIPIAVFLIITDVLKAGGWRTHET